jgi:hypothetical protein
VSCCLLCCAAVPLQSFHTSPAAAVTMSISPRTKPGNMLVSVCLGHAAKACGGKVCDICLRPVCCRTDVRLWSQAEVSDDTSSQLSANPVADTFAQLMTGLYSKLQSTAGASKWAWWLAEWFHTHPQRGWQPAATADAHGAWMGSNR